MIAILGNCDLAPIWPFESEESCFRYHHVAHASVAREGESGGQLVWVRLFAPQPYPLDERPKEQADQGYSNNKTLASAAV